MSSLRVRAVSPVTHTLLKHEQVELILFSLFGTADSTS